MIARQGARRLGDLGRIIDGATVLTDSLNFTKAAQPKNAENLLILRDPTLVVQYTRNWEAHRQHSQPYVGRGVKRGHMGLNYTYPVTGPSYAVATGATR